jgi:Ca2+-binding EF-hand superfamily protein
LLTLLEYSELPLEEAEVVMKPFEVFADADGNVQVREMALCLLLVAPGGVYDTLETRVEAIFRVIDSDNSGDLDKNGMLSGSISCFVLGLFVSVFFCRSHYCF